MADELVVVHLIGISPLHIEVVFLVMDGANRLEYVAVKRIEPLLLVTRQLSDALQQILRVDGIDNPARVCKRAVKSSEPCEPTLDTFTLLGSGRIGSLPRCCRPTPGSNPRGTRQGRKNSSRRSAACVRNGSFGERRGPQQ